MITFRVLSDEDDYFIREYEVPCSMTLLDFHRFICSDMCFGEDVMVSFHASDRNWTPLTEYTLMDMGEGSASMEGVQLSDVANDVRQRLIYVFDMLEERALYMEVVALDGTEAPARVLRSEGEAPSPDGATRGAGSIFDEAMEDFGSFDGDESYDDE
ncbi:MAG: hypothetical protein LBH06_06805 [Rikenellaceae bacterium]|jgi:hypothetical protein|nr:hypothetical protein [Rikenellaceae bacterium]